MVIVQGEKRLTGLSRAVVMTVCVARRLRGVVREVMATLLVLVSGSTNHKSRFLTFFLHFGM